MRRNRPLVEHWRALLEKRDAAEHPALSLKQWRAQVASDLTRHGYHHSIALSIYMKHVATPLPPVLVQFKPKGKWTAASKEAVIQSFTDNHVQYDKDMHGPLWFVMAHCFENLIPFVLIKLGDEYAVAEDSEQLRAELKDASAEVLYEGSGADIPRYTDL
jgi:hypothetical protein